MSLPEKMRAAAMLMGLDPDKAEEMAGSAEEFKSDMKEIKALLTEIRDFMKSMHGGN